MEEILASIRRIISEDEAPAAEGGLPIPEPEPGPEAAAAQAPEAELPDDEPIARSQESAPPFVEAEDDDSDLELTQKVESHGDLDVVGPTASEAAPAPAPATTPPPMAADIEGLVSESTAQAAATAFGALSANILMPADGRTLEDVVRELLRPLLQQWLDANLPGIVERIVTAEVERIARARVR